ncbi:MAG: ribulose-phosphate 3-epimerase [Clostridia bacterium]|nr:ribulose-phosphate 3-epimerase [Clostridia bacterium]
MKTEVCPSMMCADIFNLEGVISAFEKCSIDYLHIDIMDGSFVPNFTLGTDYCRHIKSRTDIPLDIHLMVNEPENKIEWFPIGENDFVSVHAESTNHLQRALSRIKDKGAKSMVALNPATPVCMIENVLDDIDAVLIMTVNPGYAGQKLIPSTIKKIEYARQFLDSSGYDNIKIEVDGNVSFENAVKMKKAGADMFVVGSSGIFNKDYSLEKGIELFRKATD